MLWTAFPPARKCHGSVGLLLEQSNFVTENGFRPVFGFLENRERSLRAVAWRSRRATSYSSLSLRPPAQWRLSKRYGAHDEIRRPAHLIYRGRVV